MDGIMFTILSCSDAALAGKRKSRIPQRYPKAGAADCADDTDSIRVIHGFTTPRRALGFFSVEHRFHRDARIALEILQDRVPRKPVLTDVCDDGFGSLIPAGGKDQDLHRHQEQGQSVYAYSVLFYLLA